MQVARPGSGGNQVTPGAETGHKGFGGRPPRTPSLGTGAGWGKEPGRQMKGEKRGPQGPRSGPKKGKPEGGIWKSLFRGENPRGGPEPWFSIREQRAVPSGVGLIGGREEGASSSFTLMGSLAPPPATPPKPWPGPSEDWGAPTPRPTLRAYEDRLKGGEGATPSTGEKTPLHQPLVQW
ncbi:hypothetical protein GWK47_053969 [Chionoecetes opilio]|uniref:Uncharacterized protein n=1 Tax=Chionoecetes opilio TaxID=41210 RepID=A0A8J4XYR1_CHIOP|nr:hypothetical protein GWK47_053969 [Chionoecetes opilio]